MKSNVYFGQKNDPFLLDINQKDKDKEIDKEKINIIEKNKGNELDYISSLTSRYKNEILVLKNYIQRMNVQIREHLNMEIIPSLEEGFDSFSKKLKNGAQQSEISRDMIHEWLNQLLNVDYINPLITLYENYIKNLEEELKNCKNQNKKYENTIYKIVNENNQLRNQLQISEEQLKNFLEIRNESGDSSTMIVMDRDYMMKLEERNQLLSKENELLVVNYNNLLNKLMEIKNENFYNGTGQNNINQLNQQILDLQKGNEINIKKINELQNENQLLKSKNYTYRGSLYKLNEENQAIRGKISGLNNILDNNNNN